MTLAYLQPLSYVFVYFSRLTRRQDMRNLLNQKDVICFRSDDPIIINK